MRHVYVTLGLLWCSVAIGQGTVQLPTFSTFSVNTSVLAPDRGGTYVGGVSRSFDGSVRRGAPGLGKVPGAGRTFGSRGISTGRSTGGVSVHATIVDLKALEPSVENIGPAQVGSSLSQGARLYGAGWATAAQRFQEQQGTVERLRQVRLNHQQR
jgi:type II secretory pathway component GspD/PulD (secretin)